MAVDIQLIAQLLAFEQGRAVPIASHQHIAIRPDAQVICPIAMAGEDTTIHIVAIGSLVDAPQILCAGDPRNRDEQYQLFEHLGAELESHIAACRAAGSYPQLCVPSGAAARLLDTVAERLRYQQANLSVKRFGELLSYPTSRLPISGQQTLLAATTALSMHFATGQQPGEDEHLGALLTWIDPPVDSMIHQALAEVERTPMGIHTDPDLDRDVLEPLVERWNQVLRAGDALATAQARQAIQRALEPTVRRIYDATQRAFALIRRLGLPELPDLDQLEARESAEFAFFMRGRDAGYPLALRDRPKAAAFGLVTREDAEEMTEAALVSGDAVARAQGRLTGRVIVGQVEHPRITRATPHRATYTFELVSYQPVLHVRERDEFAWAGDPRLKVSVTGIQRNGWTTRIQLQLTAGMRAVGLPTAGQQLELVASTLGWNWIQRQRRQMSQRLTVQPWTHGAAGLPLEAPRAVVSVDPLADVEALR